MKVFVATLPDRGGEIQRLLDLASRRWRFVRRRGAVVALGAAARPQRPVSMRMRFSGWAGAVLAAVSTIEMMLDRLVTFDETELDFSNAPAHRASSGDGGGPLPSQKTQTLPRRFP